MNSDLITRVISQKGERNIEVFEYEGSASGGLNLNEFFFVIIFQEFLGFLNIFIVNKVKISTKMYLIYGASNSFI